MSYEITKKYIRRKLFPSTWNTGLNWPTPLFLAWHMLSPRPNNMLSKIQSRQLRSELFGRRHSTLQSHGLFALAKHLYIYTTYSSTHSILLTLIVCGWVTSTILMNEYWWISQSYILVLAIIISRSWKVLGGRMPRRFISALISSGARLASRRNLSKSGKSIWWHINSSRVTHSTAWGQTIKAPTTASHMP